MPCKPTGTCSTLNVSKLFSANMLGLVIAIGITVLLTYRLGSTDQADAYVMARRLVTSLTELLYRAMLMIFIPMLAVELFVDEARRRRQLINWSWRLLSIGAVSVIVLWLVTPAVVGALGSGMSDETRALTAFAIRLMLLSIPAIMLANLYTAGLFLNDSFGLPALLKQLPRLLVLLVFSFAGAAFLVETASLGFALGSYLFLAGCVFLIWWRKPGTDSREKPSGDAKRSANVSVVLLMMAGPQIVSWMEIYFAVKLGEGALTVLELSQRTATLIGTTFVASTIMPHLAAWSRSPLKRTPQSFGRAFWVGLLLLICAQGFFMLNARDVLDLLYLESRLTAETLEEMTSLVVIMAVSPLMTYLYQIFAVWNIACGRQGMAWVVFVAIAANLAVRAGLATSLLPTLGLHALALGMIFGPGAAGLVVIAFGDRSYWLGQYPGRAAWLALLAAGLALAGMAAGRWIAQGLAPDLGLGGRAGAALVLSALIGGGVFAFCAWRFRLLSYLRI